MKSNRTEVRDQRSKVRIRKFILFIFLLVFVLLFAITGSRFPSCAQEADLTLRIPVSTEEIDDNIPLPPDLKSLPDFPRNKKLNSKGGTIHRISVNATTIPVDTRLRLSIDSLLDAKTSKVGDYFKAHVLEDFYIPCDPPQLIIPRGSWVRGRVSFIKRPTLFSKAGKIGLHLYQLVTSLGDVTTLDAELDVQQGIVNEQGLLDPMTNFKTKAIQPTQELLDATQGRVITVATLGTPIIGTLIAGTLTALFSQGDNITLNKGQELQIVLKKDIQLTIN